MTGAVLDHFLPEQDLLAALRDHAQTQAVDAMQRFGGRIATMERERRNGGGVITVGLGKVSDGASQGADRFSLGHFWPGMLVHRGLAT